MSRHAVLALVSVIGALLASGLRAAEQPRQVVKGWGQAEDPDGDCQFTAQDGNVTIAVPGTPHDLWPKQGKTNAPRILQDVEGDFAVQVKVSSTVKPENGFFRSGTLLIWQDDGTFVRLDSACADRGASGYDFFCYLHVFKNGDRTVNEQLRPLKDAPTVLRLERQDGRVSASFSQDDGKSWRSFGQKTMDFSSRLKAGVAALNATKSPFSATFEDLKITK